MEQTSPAGWRRLVEGDGVMRAAGEELRVCQEAAARTGRDQRCTVTVRPSTSSMPSR